MTEALNLLKKLVKIQSLTPVNDVPARNRCQRTLDILSRHANRSKADVVSIYTFGEDKDKNDYPVDNLLVRWRSGNPVNTLCYLGHTDIVKVNEKNWSKKPFGGDIENGRIYGRGTTDMKGSVAAFFTAMQNLSLKGADLDVYAIITTDEERWAINGTRPMLNVLKENGINPAAFLVGEPSASATFGDTIAIGRPGSLNGAVRVLGKAGHAAYPNTFENPLPLAMQIALDIGNIELQPKAGQGLPARPQVRRIISEGEDNTAIIPYAVTLNWNVRFPYGYTAEEVFGLIQQKVLRSEKVSLTANLHDASEAYYGQPPASSGLLLQTIQQVLTRQLGTPALTTTHGGTSDARFVQNLFSTAEVLELGPPTQSMHGDDENLALPDLESMANAYEATVEEFCDPACGRI